MKLEKIKELWRKIKWRWVALFSIYLAPFALGVLLLISFAC